MASTFITIKEEVSKKIHERLRESFESLGISLGIFSKEIGHTRTWAYNLIYRNAGGLKAIDLASIEATFRINSQYILNGKKPMFLEKK